LSEKNVGKIRTARLSGGMETGRTALSWGKGQVSFQMLEKSDIPATGGCPLASMRSISGTLYLMKLHKASLHGKKAEPFEVIRPECLVVWNNPKIFPKFYRPTVFIRF
jgi:hypothetical protein